MVTPVIHLFGRRMKLHHCDGLTVKRCRWELVRGPFEFSVYHDGYLGNFRARVSLGHEVFSEQNRTTLEGALRSLTSMRNRLVRQLQDKA